MPQDTEFALTLLANENKDMCVIVYVCVRAHLFFKMWQALYLTLRCKYRLYCFLFFMSFLTKYYLVI